MLHEKKQLISVDTQKRNPCWAALAGMLTSQNQGGITYLKKWRLHFVVPHCSVGEQYLGNPQCRVCPSGGWQRWPAALTLCPHGYSVYCREPLDWWQTLPDKKGIKGNIYYSNLCQIICHLVSKVFEVWWKTMASISGMISQVNISSFHEEKKTRSIKHKKVKQLGE